MRRLLAAATASFAVLTAPAPAATVEIGPDPEIPQFSLAAHYVAARGESNVVRVSKVANGAIRITDSGAVVEAGKSCRSIDEHTAECGIFRVRT
jgi:hypothetical protein